MSGWDRVRRAGRNSISCSQSHGPPLTSAASEMILVIDNYDSFTFNLVQYLGELKADLRVVRNDEVTLDQIRALNPERILVSPGPCSPREAGLSNDIIRAFGPHVPLFGVCLGHQCIGHTFGGEVVVNYRMMHGKTSPIRHNGEVEALARWHHPEFGNVPPMQFIPVAEECGLIIELGEAVLRQVCRQLAEWQRTGVPVVPVAINVSAQQLQRVNLADLIRSATAEAGISPALLEIELTESVIMTEIERHIGTLGALRAMGVKVSIDDFGTGYSSLSYLKHLPIDYLKIDRSFVRDMTTDENDAAIVSAIINMARSLQLQTIAEGVETLEQATRLAAAGCDFAQGYYYSSPLPAEECGLLLKELDRIGGQSDQFKALVDSVREIKATSSKS